MLSKVSYFVFTEQLASLAKARIEFDPNTHYAPFVWPSRSSFGWEKNKPQTNNYFSPVVVS